MVRPTQMVIEALAHYSEARRCERDPKTAWKMCWSLAREIARERGL